MSRGESRLGSHPRPDSSFGQAYALPWGPLCVPCMDLGYARPHAHHAPRPPGYATQKATPLRERAATGPLREPGQHSGSQGRPGPSPVPDSDGPLNPAPRRLGRPMAGESGPLTTIGPGRKPSRSPGPGMERGGAGVARREAGAHIRTRSGVPNRFLPPRLATGPDPLGSGSGTQIAARGRCMQPGRSQGNQLPGRWTGA